MARRIPQPRDQRFKQYKTEVRLAWNRAFGKNKSAMMDNAQKYVDSECIRLMVQYTPARNNLLYKSAVLGTKIGSGHIYYQSPYARYQYYGIVFGPNIPIYEQGKIVGFYSPPKKYKTNRRLKYDKTRHPKAQARWFETMKTNHKEQILRGTAAITKKG